MSKKLTFWSNSDNLSDTCFKSSFHTYCAVVFMLLEVGLTASFGQNRPDPSLMPGSQSLATQRVFKIYQTFALPDAGSSIAPLSSNQKFELFRKQTFDPGMLAVSAAIAGLQTGGNLSPLYGSDGTAYAQRFGAMTAVISTGSLFSQAVFPSVFHQDPRYFPRRRGSALTRIGYSLSRTVITYKDNGATSFNSSQILGSALTTASTNFYYPPADRTVIRNAEGFGIALGVSAAINVLREFTSH